MSARRQHLVVMAAGTGGHVIPGLAVARELQLRGWQVSWLGTPSGMENKLVPPTGIPLDRIGFAGLRGKGVLGSLLAGFQLLRAFAQSWSILRRHKPTAVLGMGGYVCVPGGVMAAAVGAPLVLVNADAQMLLSNRVLAPFADAIAFGFPCAAASETDKALVTGNPVRAEISGAPAPSDRFAGRSGPLRVLVVGGSSGAQALNDCVPQALALLGGSFPIELTHQCGAAHVARVVQQYEALGLSSTCVRGFLDDMPQQLVACDVVVCRAGAVTVSELCAAGVASVLVPLVVSTTSHQRDNARMLAQQGAAVHLPQTELSAARLAEVLRGLNRERLLGMALRAKELAMPAATTTVADLIERLAGAAIWGRA